MICLEFGVAGAMESLFISFGCRLVRLNYVVECVSVGWAIGVFEAVGCALSVVVAVLDERLYGRPAELSTLQSIKLRAMYEHSRSRQRVFTRKVGACCTFLNYTCP